jgi:ABC-type lipopolysaccharide export system ATPase subunit
VEQNARQSLKVAHFAYLLEHGRVVEAGPATDIAGKKSVQEVFSAAAHRKQRHGSFSAATQQWLGDR